MTATNSFWRFGCGGSLDPNWVSPVLPPGDVVPSSVSAPYYCYSNTDCNGDLLMQVVWKTSCIPGNYWCGYSLAYGTIMMPILSYNTISDPSFATATYSLSVKIGGASKLQSKDEKVYEHPSMLITFDGDIMQLSLKSSSSSLQLCLDNFFFLGWNYLNLQATQLQLGQYETSDWTHLEILNQTLSPFSQFLDHSLSCFDYSQKAIGTGLLGFNAIFTTDNNVGSQYKLINIYVQVGPNQNLLPWSLRVYNSSVDNATSSHTWAWGTALSSQTGSQFINFANGLVGAEFAIVSEDPLACQFCQIQLFGGVGCSYIQIKERWQSFCYLPTQKIDSFYFNTTVYDSEKNPADYCMTGITAQIYIGSAKNLVDSSTFQYDIATHVMGFNFQGSQYLNSSIQDVTLGIDLYDSRSNLRSATFSVTLNFTLCDPSFLELGIISLLDGTWDIEYWQNSGIQLNQYQFVVGCTNTQKYTSVVFTTDTGQVVTKNPATFLSCQTQALGLCLFHNTTSYSLDVYSVRSNSSLNSLVMKITAKVVFVSVDCNNQMQTGTTPIYQIFTLTQKSCSETTFKNPNILFKSNNQPNHLFDLQTKLLNPYSLTQVIFNVSDTLSVLKTPFDGFSFCGRRQFTIIADSQSKNLELAQELLSPNCTSCLIATSVGFTSILSAEILDQKYTGTTFSFKLQISLLDQYAPIQPTSLYPFTLTVEPNKILYKAPFFYPALENAYTLQIGKLLQLPLIQSPQNSTVSAIFNIAPEVVSQGL